MRAHSFYPTAYPTARPSPIWRVLRWMTVIVVLAFMVLGLVTLYAVLSGREAQLDSAFMQGMTAGAQMCGRRL